MPFLSGLYLVVDYMYVPSFVHESAPSCIVFLQYT